MVVNLTAHYWEGIGRTGHPVRDISTGGAFISADFKWMPGTTLTLTLRWEGHVPDSGPPVARSYGRRWSASHRMGSAFSFFMSRKASGRR